MTRLLTNEHGILLENVPSSLNHKHLLKTDQVEVSLQITSTKYSGTDNTKDDLNCYI